MCKLIYSCMYVLDSTRSQTPGTSFRFTKDSLKGAFHPWGIIQLHWTLELQKTQRAKQAPPGSIPYTYLDTRDTQNPAPADVGIQYASQMSLMYSFLNHHSDWLPKDGLSYNCGCCS